MGFYYLKIWPKYDWYLSHKQSSGEGLALPLFLEMEKLGEATFLDFQAEGKLELIECSTFFVLLLTPEIFDSERNKEGTNFLKLSLNFL